MQNAEFRTGKFTLHLHSSFCILHSAFPYITLWPEFSGGMRFAKRRDAQDWRIQDTIRPPGMPMRKQAQMGRGVMAMRSNGVSVRNVTLAKRRPKRTSQKRMTPAGMPKRTHAHNGSVVRRSKRSGVIAMRARLATVIRPSMHGWLKRIASTGSLSVPRSQARQGIILTLRWEPAKRNPRWQQDVGLDR